MSFKAHRLVKALVGAAALAATSTAFTAQEARTMLVTASIQGGCTILTPPMAFGALNIAAPTLESKVVTVSYRCAPGTTVTGFSVGGANAGAFNGVLTGAANAANTIAYTINWNPASALATTTNFAVPHEVTLTGNITAAAYANKAPDNYSQGVIVAIDF